MRGLWREFRLPVSLIACILPALPGCAPTPPPLTAAEAAVPADGRYLLGSGDKLRIVVFNETNLTGEYTVSPTGTVTFPLIGVVPAKSGSIEDLREAIRARLADGFLNEPSVSVEVLNYRPFYILGEVNKPGEYPYSAGLTLEQAVAAAGGYTYRANKTQLFLRRARSDGERSVPLRGKAVEILPGDTLRVGERFF